MKPINLPLEAIDIKDRLRKDLGDIKELADSLRQYGLIEPIVVDQNNRLIAGERRIRAAQLLEWKEIPAVYRETLTVDELHELELEENYQRKDMTWQERCVSVKTIHQLKANNAALAGQGWGQVQTAALLNLKSNCSVSYALVVADLIEKEDKEVIACDSLMSAYRLIVRRKEDAAMKLLVARQAAMNLPRQAPSEDLATAERLLATLEPRTEDSPKSPQEAVNRPIPLSRRFYNMDCRAYMEDMRAGSFQYIISDPPYAIDLENMEQDGSALSDMSAVRAEHDKDENILLLEEAVPQMCYLLKDKGWLVLWTDQQTYPLLQQLILEQPSMRVQRWPLVWVKSHICKNEQASKNFTKTVEVAIVAAKGTATLVCPSPTCHWIGSNEDERKESGHPFAKPLGLWEWIYHTVCMQGSVVFDPFIGRGSSALAAMNTGLIPMGCESNETHYAHLIQRVKNRYLSYDSTYKFE